MCKRSLSAGPHLSGSTAAPPGCSSAIGTFDGLTTPAACRDHARSWPSPLSASVLCEKCLLPPQVVCAHRRLTLKLKLDHPVDSLVCMSGLSCAGDGGSSRSSRDQVRRLPVMGADVASLDQLGMARQKRWVEVISRRLEKRQLPAVGDAPFDWFESTHVQV